MIETPFSTDTIQSLSFPHPVLDFCPLPFPESNPAKPNLILIATDPSWKYRTDGGKAFFPGSNNEGWFKSRKGKDKKKGKKGGDGDGDVDMDAEAALNEEIVPEEKEEKINGYTVKEVDEMCESALRMVRVNADNTVSIGRSARKDISLYLHWDSWGMCLKSTKTTWAISRPLLVCITEPAMLYSS